jgi:hypothetical protein
MFRVADSCNPGMYNLGEDTVVPGESGANFKP